MQERERRRANVSTISGKRRVRSFAGTAAEPHLRAVLAGNDAEAVTLDLSQYTSEQIVKNLSPISKNSTPLAQRSLH